MEFAAAPPKEQPGHEKLKSFDVMASVDMMRFDLQRFGYVLPETRSRVYDEELSSMAEGVERAAHTSFTFQRQNGELMYFSGGTWRPYAGLLLTGLEVAKNEKAEDPRRAFLADWAVRDLEKGYAMQKLQPGEQMVWTNSYPHDMELLHGKDFLQKDCGLFPDRKMGFIYRAECREDGSVTLESQTIDRSDADALRRVEQVALYDAQADMDTLVRSYDGVLVQKYGGRFFAGRLGAERHENAWQEIIRQRDLVEYFLDELEHLAASELPRPELQFQTEKLVFGAWKAFKNRLHGTSHYIEDYQYNAAAPSPVVAAIHQEQLAREVDRSFHQAVAAGEVKSGCGGSVSFSKDSGTPGSTLDSADNTFDAIFGEKSKTAETYKFDKKMYCVVCQAPPKEKESKKMCGPCGICKPCDAVLKAKQKYTLAA